MAKLVLIRHGKSQYNIDKRFTGFTDISITADEGVANAHTVAEKLKAQGLQFDQAYTSWLKRAWETLDIVLTDLGQTGLPVTKHPFLNERHYGDLQGRMHEDMIAEFGEEQVQIWRRSYATRPPNGESLKDVVHRVQYYFTYVIQADLAAGKNVLVCAHGNTNRALVKMLDHISDDEIVKREIAYDEPLIYEL